MFYFINVVRSFVNYAIFRDLCDWMGFEVDCAKYVAPSRNIRRPVMDSNPAAATFIFWVCIRDMIIACIISQSDWLICRC